MGAHAQCTRLVLAADPDYPPLHWFDGGCFDCDCHVFGGGFDEYMKQNLNIEEANSPENNFSKLIAGRLDYFVTGFYAGMAHLLKRGDEERFVVKSPFVVETANYLALTRNGHCADKLDAIDARLALLKKNGVLDELIRQSFTLWKARPVVVVK